MGFGPWHSVLEQVTYVGYPPSRECYPARASRMLQTPPEVAARFDAAMLAAGVAEHHRPHFCRWLRFYLDFCDKYRGEPTDAASLRAFEEKHGSNL